MKKIITIICDVETTIPHLLNQEDFEVVATSKEEVWTLIKKEKPQTKTLETIPIITKVVSTIENSTGLDL